MSAAVALAALSAAPAALAQKAHGADTKKKKKDGAKDGHKNKGKGAKKDHAAAAAAPAAQPAPAAKKAEAPIEVRPVALSLPVTRLTLDNGLRVVMNVDRSSPTVGIAVVYGTGARDEERGKSGFAHLFEHMMFQGSKNLQKGEHMRLVAGRGGVLDAYTDPDHTSYFEVLPSNELALGLWLEADRMKALDVSRESFESQRAVVKEEHRMRVSNAAYAPSAIRLQELVYQGCWPYEHSGIGSMADLDAAQLDWVKDFHARRYGPNNAVLAIAGDFEQDEAAALVKRYFEKAPKIELAALTDTAVPEQTSQRTGVVKDDHALTAAVHYGWVTPPERDAQVYALDLAAIILGEGESSRLHQLLVRDKAAAQRVSASLDRRRGPSLFEVFAQLTPRASPGEVERWIDGAVRDFAASGPTAAELAKAQRRAQSRLVFSLQTNGSRALSLAERELSFGDAAPLADEPARYLAVTAEDVKKAVGQHLTLARRTVVETYPAQDVTDAADKKAKPAAPASPPRDAASGDDAKKRPAAVDAKKKKTGAADPKKKKKAEATKAATRKKKASP